MPMEQGCQGSKILDTKWPPQAFLLDGTLD
jgi:hypothetical protein